MCQGVDTQSGGLGLGVGRPPDGEWCFGWEMIFDKRKRWTGELSFCGVVKELEGLSGGRESR